MTRKEAVSLFEELNKRGFRICESAAGGDYLNGYTEFAPISYNRAIAVLLVVHAPKTGQQ